MNTIKSLDGLRGLAALLVIPSHFTVVAPRFLHGAARDSGHAGVMIFFMLSGFLMGYLYLAQAPTGHAIARFLVRRGARVVPLYAVVVLACFAIASAPPDLQLWAYKVDSLRRLAEHLAMIRGSNALWTVPLEVQFYLLVPLLWLAAASAPRATLVGLGATIAALYLCHATLDLTHDSLAARAAVALPYFLAGLAISRLVTPATGGRAWDVLFVAALAAMLLCYPALVPPSRLGASEAWHSPLILIVVTLLLIATLRSRLAEIVLGSRLMRFLGRISYGIYLLHMLILTNLARVTGLQPKAYILFALSLVVILAAAQLAYVLIERPARDGINRWFDRRAPGLAKQAA